MLYNLIKWIHILAAIVAVGANATYGLWLARASRSPENLPFTLKTIKVLDDRMANPSYGLLLLTGLLMVFLGPWPLTSSWLAIALVLYVIAVLLGLLGYSPTLRRQIRAAETSGPASPESAALARRGTLLGIILAVVVVIIELVMVTKPQLW